MEIFWLEYSSAVRLTLVVTLLSSAVRNIGVIADSAKDKEECAQQLTGLATCLPYVGGKAKAPTPDCCTGLKQLLKNNKKCLCVIIKDRNDPDLGLQINVTLATSLPSVCNSPANISKCPGTIQMSKLLYIYIYIFSAMVYLILLRIIIKLFLLFPKQITK